MVRFALFAALVLCTACGGRPTRPGIPPRHLLLVTVEGLRADHCSAYLYSRDTTTFPIDPGMRAAGRDVTLDELAHAGTLFTQAFAPTGQVAASLAAIHTGQGAAGQEDMGSAQVTLAEAFSAAGFETAAFISTQSGTPELARGFATFESAGGDRATLARAVTFISARDWGNGRGLFLWVHLTQPAFPFEPSTLRNHLQQTIDYAKLYVDPGYDGPAKGTEAFREQAQGLTPADVQHLVDLYDGELALTNYLLWYMVDYYRYNGVTSAAWSSTLTVLAGVNGMTLGADRWGTTDSLRDDSLRVPLVLRHPDSLTGRRIFAEVVTLSDVAPTVGQWFDLELDQDGVHGRSLLAITDSKGTFPTRPAVAFDPASGDASLRTEDWRLVAERAALAGVDGAVALYPVKRMREAAEDVSAQHPELAAGLLDELRARLGGSAAR
jgi:arylsulfatase A-like enzyme